MTEGAFPFRDLPILVSGSDYYRHFHYVSTPSFSDDKWPADGANVKFSSLHQNVIVLMSDGTNWRWIFTSRIASIGVGGHTP
jgi:hypothetical protein